jgi:hypothetical protein
MIPEESKEGADLKRRTQEVWKERPLLEVTGTTKPQVYTFSWTIYDKVADDKISEILKSSQFCRETVQYSYEGSPYELVVIFNPEKKPLRKAVYEAPITQVLIIESPKSIPALLKKHLEELCIQNRIDPADTIFNLTHYGIWGSLRSLTIVSDPPVIPKRVVILEDNKKVAEVVMPKSTEPKPIPIPVAPKEITTPVESKSTESKVESASRLRELFRSLFG